MGSLDLLMDCFFGIVGTLVGSFLNVVAWRLPRGRSLVWPGSRCPTCAMPVRPWHNLPVLGWLALGGRCFDCRTPIHWRYPLVELATGLLFVAAAHTFARPYPLLAALFLLSIWLVLALTDFDLRLLPVSLTGAVLVAGLALWWVPSWTTGRDVALGLSAAVALAAGSRLYRLLHGVDGLGDGDALLLAGIAAWTGWRGALLALALAVGSTVVGLLVVGLIDLGGAGGRRVDPARFERLPFGTGLALGGIVALFVAAGWSPLDTGSNALSTAVEWSTGRLR